MQDMAIDKEEMDEAVKEAESSEKEKDAEMDAAVQEAEKRKDVYTYTHELAEEFEYEEKKYKTMHFNWRKLRGSDALAIESEMQAQGMLVAVPSLSGGYLIRMAARAGGVPLNALLALPIQDYNKIRSEARSFLLKTEL